MRINLIATNTGVDWSQVHVGKADKAGEQALVTSEPKKSRWKPFVAILRRISPNWTKTAIVKEVRREIKAMESHFLHEDEENGLSGRTTDELKVIKANIEAIHRQVFGGKGPLDQELETINHLLVDKALEDKPSSG